MGVMLKKYYNTQLVPKMWKTENVIKIIYKLRSKSAKTISVAP